MTFLKKVILLLSAAGIIISTGAKASAPIVEFGEPHYSIVDGNNVNMASGLLYYNLNTVSIGSGPLTLSHHITINSSDAVNLDAYISGYKDKYRGGVRRTVHTDEYSENNQRKFFEVIQVADHEGSYDFIINQDGAFEGLAGGLDTLTVADDSRHFILTKRNGTRVYFYSRSVIPSVLTPDYSAYASMVKIEEPNGFTITIHKQGTAISDKITSVTTNNGLQLKYIYDVHSRPLEAAKRSATSNPNVPADSLNWSDRFPSKIIALNNAVEVCPTTGNVCSVNGLWPEAQFYWPDGMPRAMYIGQSTFKVKSANGVSTEFIHKAIDIEQGRPYPVNPGTYFFPRITQVKNTTGLDVSYTYANGFTLIMIPPFYSTGYGSRGVLTKAINHGVTTTYNFMNGGRNIDRGYTARQVWASGYKAINYVNVTNNQYFYSSQARLAVPYEVGSWESNIYLDRDFSNKVNKIENKLNGQTTEYIYDDYGRLKTVDTGGMVVKYTYPYMYYPGQCVNYKFCHKPASVTQLHMLNATRGVTGYQYHPQSGGVSIVTYPAHAANKVGKEFYQYQQYYARYKNSSGSMITASVPIWLVSSKSYCKNSNASGTNCTGNDKVTITYEYGSGTSGNNLFLLGEKVSAQDETTTWTTCYQYDRYGNRIGSTSPKSGITDCNIGREY